MFFRMSRNYGAEINKGEGHLFSFNCPRNKAGGKVPAYAGITKRLNVYIQQPHTDIAHCCVEDHCPLHVLATPLQIVEHLLCASGLRHIGPALIS